MVSFPGDPGPKFASWKPRLLRYSCNWRTSSPRKPRSRSRTKNEVFPCGWLIVVTESAGVAPGEKLGFAIGKEG